MRNELLQLALRQLFRDTAAVSKHHTKQELGANPVGACGHRRCLESGTMDMPMMNRMQLRSENIG